MGVNKKQLQLLQETDETLRSVRHVVDQPSQPFVKRDGLLFRKWEHRAARERGETEPVVQLILPRDCRQGALELAHLLGTLEEEDVCPTRPTILLAIHESRRRGVLPTL